MPPRTVFTEEMTSLNREVVAMGDLARTMVKHGVQAFLDNDVELMEEVARLDKEIYRMDQAIEKHCVEIIALHQPVAVDLRTVTTCLKIITDLNRIGRYGRDIAELADRQDNGKKLKRIMAIPLMSELSLAMVNEAIDSFVNRDDRKARTLFARDDEVDSLWDSIFRESLTHMMEDPRNISFGTHYILVARYLERIADHACNIGDRVVFMVTGTRVDPYERKMRRRESNDNPAPRPEGSMTSTDGYYSTHLSEK
jgi:phosphate transport system protein